MTKELRVSTSTVTAKGQTTIPKAVRERLHLRPGDRVEFVFQKDSVVLRAASRDVRDLKGFLPKPKKAVTIEHMNAAIRKRAAQGAL